MLEIFNREILQQRNQNQIVIDKKSAEIMTRHGHVTSERKARAVQLRVTGIQNKKDYQRHRWYASIVHKLYQERRWPPLDESKMNPNPITKRHGWTIVSVNTEWTSLLQQQTRQRTGSDWRDLLQPPYVISNKPWNYKRINDTEWAHADGEKSSNLVRFHIKNSSKHNQLFLHCWRFGLYQRPKR